MSADDEYVAYVGTRWADLVRAVVALGCARRDAEPLVRSVLMRVYRGWEEAWRDDLSEIHVGGLLLDAVRCRTPGPSDVALGTDDGPVDPTGALDHGARTDLLRTLDLTEPDAREALVLHYVAGLSVDQTARVLGRPVPVLVQQLRETLAALPRPVDEPEDLRCPSGGGDLT